MKRTSNNTSVQDSGLASAGVLAGGVALSGAGGVTVTTCKDDDTSFYCKFVRFFNIFKMVLFILVILVAIYFIYLFFIKK